MRRIRTLIAVLLVLGYALGVTGVQANHETDPDIADIVVVTPETYASCVNEETSDTISITNVGSRVLRGQVVVDFVLDGGVRQTFQTYPVNQAGDLNLEVVYPPVSEWPVQSGGTAEIHVDLQIEVYDASGAFLLGAIGPEHDWDVFCLNPPPPPPPPPPPTGEEGCTPGYWKQDHHFDSWPAAYSQSDDFDTIFGVDLFSPDLTLLDALKQGGGGNARLGRHGTAALLSAASSGVDYPYTVDQVIAFVQAGNADALETANELGCPLD